MSNKNKIYIALIIIILALGAFLRVYHFSDWLHFELDQSRDAKIIDLAAKEGIGNLPLLGPKAAGTFLRLGPIFYYFNYLSALVFGNTPAGIATIICIFGILAMSVFYLFIRRYFDKNLSLGLLLVFSISLFFVMYSRFSWNPNPLALFTVLTFYFLLRTADKEDKRRGLWLILFFISLIISSQLHFLAFMALPAISFLFLIIKRPRIKAKFWAISFLLAILLYTPVFINEYMTGGDNVKEFFKATEKKSTKDEHTLIEKVVKSYNENALGYFVALSGQENLDVPRLVKTQTFYDIKCDNTCKKKLPWGTVAFLFFTAGLFLSVRKYWKEKDPAKKDFVLLILCWILVTLVLFIPISFSIAPRFFLLVTPLPFVFLGYLIEFLGEKSSKKTFLILIIALCGLLAVSNLLKIKERFWQMSRAPFESFEIPADKILKERHRVTLEQQYKVFDLVKKKYDENKFPVYLSSDPFYSRALLYHIAKAGIPADDFKNIKKVYAKGNYFLVFPTESNFEEDLVKYGQKYDLIGRKAFGTLTLLEFSPKKELVNADIQTFAPAGKPQSSAGVPVRYRWEEIFNESEGADSEDL